MKSPLVELERVSAARSGRVILQNIALTIRSGDRIFIAGENGAGKSTLLLLLAAKLHPYNNAGTRRYAWDNETGESYRAARKHIGLVSRDEQHRLQGIHGGSTVAEFLTGHLDGQDFLYRAAAPGDAAVIYALLEQFGLERLAGRKLKTLSLGEMRLTLIARVAMHPRRLYLLDEIFSSLSAAVAERIGVWIRHLDTAAAVVITGHDSGRIAQFSYTDRYMVAGGGIVKLAATPVQLEPPATAVSASAPKMAREVFIDCANADFYHDFTLVLSAVSFQIRQGDRILVTGENGSGKTTLLRIMHGDFYPAWGKGTLRFSGALAHEHKRELWAQVQFVAAAHFAYYPERMSVRDVLASRYSGSIYDYANTLPPEASLAIEGFAIGDFLARPFSHLSEGEKTRVLFARAFLYAAPVYLIDEGFIALSERFFDTAVRYLNSLPATSVIVIAANERVEKLQARLTVTPAQWHCRLGRLFCAPEASLL